VAPHRGAGVVRSRRGPTEGEGRREGGVMEREEEDEEGIEGVMTEVTKLRQKEEKHFQ